MSKAVKLELSATDASGSTFSFTSSFEEAAVPLSQLELIYEEAASLVRSSLISTEAEIESQAESKVNFTGIIGSQMEAERKQAQMRAIRENPGEAAAQINRLAKDREHLQERLGKTIEKLQRTGISQQKIEDLYTRTKARGLAPFAIDLNLQQADLQIEKMHRAITDGMQREDKLLREVIELRARLMAAGLASEDEIMEWKKQG